MFGDGAEAVGEAGGQGGKETSGEDKPKEDEVRQSECCAEDYPGADEFEGAGEFRGAVEFEAEAADDEDGAEAEEEAEAGVTIGEAFRAGKPGQEGLEAGMSQHEGHEHDEIGNDPEAAVEHRPLVRSELPDPGQKKEEEGQEEAQEAAAELEQVREGQPGSDAQGEDPQEVAQGRADVLVIMEDEIGIEEPLRRAEQEIDQDERGQDGPGGGSAVGLAHEQQAQQDEPEIDAAQRIGDRAVEAGRRADSWAKGAEVLFGGYPDRTGGVKGYSP